MLQKLYCYNIAAMEAKKLIEILGGDTEVARLLNKHGNRIFSRQRIFNWRKNNIIPSYAILDYPKIWRKAGRLLEAKENER